MQENDKDVTRLIKSMKRSLQDQFGVNVPHAALRASYLLARGEQPHAFAGKKFPSVEPRKEVVASVLFEWVYPDEDGDSVQAFLNLDTGKLSNIVAPADIVSEEVRTRIEVGPDEELFDVHYRRASASSGDWFVDAADLPDIRRAIFPDSWRIPEGLFPAEWGMHEPDLRERYCVIFDDGRGHEYEYSCDAHNPEEAVGNATEDFPNAKVREVKKVEASPLPKKGRNR